MADFGLRPKSAILQGSKNSTTEAGGSKTLGQLGVDGLFWPYFGTEKQHY